MIENSVSEIQMLVFSDRGIKMAVDTTAIGGILDYKEALQRQAVIKNLFGMKKDTGRSKVLMVKGSAQECGIAIDRLEEIISFGIDAIKPMPALIESMFWAAALKGDEVILLLDLSDFSCLPDSEKNMQAR